MVRDTQYTSRIIELITELPCKKLSKEIAEGGRVTPPSL